MSTIQIGEIYGNLNTLLDDICQFLQDGNNYSQLSPIAKQISQNLLSRCKSQLTEINLALTANTPDQEYMEMDKQPAIVEPKTVAQDPLCKFTEESFHSQISAMDLQTSTECIKHGELRWKSKASRFFLNIETIRQIYGGIIGHWLLIYFSEKDLKPKHAIDLRNYTVRRADSKGRKLQAFELSGNNKIYYFIASTYKDLDQWITKISSSNGAPENLHQHLSKTISNELDANFRNWPVSEPTKSPSHISKATATVRNPTRIGPDTRRITDAGNRPLPPPPPYPPSCPKFKDTPIGIPVEDDTYEKVGPTCSARSSFSSGSEKESVYDVVHITATPHFIESNARFPKMLNTNKIK